jgi:two-component system, OmpR family, response regulator
VHPDHVPEVALVMWPSEEALRRRLAAARSPRLLLVDADLPPPPPYDELEDWIRYPPDPDEIAIRVATLRDRARDVLPRALSLELDADDILHVDGRWAALPAVEARVFAALLERAGDLVSRRDLTAAAWLGEPPADGRALNGVVKRLRRRVTPLGVRIHTVRGLGFLLDYTPDGS